MGNVEVYMSVIFSDVCEDFFFFLTKQNFQKKKLKEMAG